MNQRVEDKVQALISANRGEDAFMVYDEEALDSQLRLWRECLPMVAPYYAVKCNNDVRLLAHLRANGLKFDCASQAEIELVLSNAIGASSTDIVFANPVKPVGNVAYAKKVGVRRTTFDNIDELEKIAETYPEMELLLRIETDDSGATCALSCKYGAKMLMVAPLLARAKELNLNVVGVAFHVGSGQNSRDGAEAHRIAFRDSARVFEIAESEFDMHFKVLDIGGGFCADEMPFREVSATVRDDILKFPYKVEVIAEPGRFFAEPAMTLAAHVIGVRREPGVNDMVYLSDGVYGNLNSVIYDHHEPVPMLLDGKGIAESQQDEEQRGTTCSLWGPTCDGLDCVCAHANLPRPVKRGDWVLFPRCGAYTLVGGSQFNGFNMNTEVHAA